MTGFAKSDEICGVAHHFGVSFIGRSRGFVRTQVSSVFNVIKIKLPRDRSHLPSSFHTIKHRFTIFAISFNKLCDTMS